ncbi:MAG: nucleotidyl transferase AbiEii/AbiGii toxin family protein [Steroidobacter sp.]
MTVSKEDVEQHEATGPWRSLIRVAESLVADAEATAGSEMRPLLGDGTRLMLSLHHRISDDIDLFIRDPQWIGYLTPRLNDHTESQVDGYEESAISLKLRQGEIDFIVAMSLLKQPAQSFPKAPFAIEPMAEVLAKKLFYRGSMLTPRDLFDWWAIKTTAPKELPQHKLGSLLKDRLDGIESALHALRQSATAQDIWSSLRAPSKPSLGAAIDFGLQCLEEYRQIGRSSDRDPSPFSG